MKLYSVNPGAGVEANHAPASNGLMTGRLGSELWIPGRQLRHPGIVGTSKNTIALCPIASGVTVPSCAVSTTPFHSLPRGV